MSWNFNAELADLAPDQAGADIPRGLKITKTFIDDASGATLVTVITTKEDAKENAEPGFIQEYVDLARIQFSEWLDKLLNYSDGVRDENPTSHASLYGIALRDAVETINYLTED